MAQTLEASRGPGPDARETPRGQYVELTWTPSAAGARKAERTPRRYRAWIPDAIADFEPTLRSSTAALCERAGVEVRQLNSEPGTLMALEGLGRQLLRSESLASSQIEGLDISHRKLAETEFSDLAHYKAREIVGTIRAMERALEIGAAPGRLTVESIQAIHREIAVVPPLDKIAGQIREEPSWIGGADPSVAEYVGPPAEEVPGLLDDLCQFMDRDDLSPVAQAAIAHAQFELIHPFGDGNGRVGRCLIQVLLRRRGLAPRFLPPISIVLGSGKDVYISGIDAFRTGAVDQWGAYFARATESAALGSREFSEEVADLQGDWRAVLQPVRSDSAALALIDLLPRFPILTAAAAEDEIDRSRRATITGLERLADAGILTRHRNQKKGDSWEAKDLFALLDEFERRVGRSSR
ncbi:MAG TPA: Fic family protein [Solirubrobacterales bacterium]|jgi:Fic family protein|nr:Fic family protein [Solirubrobacterales bacterium]